VTHGLRATARHAWRAVVLAVVATGLLAACCKPPARDARGWPKVLVLGLVPANESDKMVDNLGPLTEYLSKRLGVPVRAFVPQDYTGLVEAMGSGRADIGMMPPFAAMLGARRYAIEPMLISVRKGEVGYHAQWMTRDASVCKAPPHRDANGMLACDGDLARVRGRSVAFTDPNSTSGYLYPAFQLKQLGIDPDRDVQGLFVRSHDAAVLAVYSGDTDFGVSYNDARKTVQKQYPDVGDKVIVFARTGDVPNDGVQVRADLPPDLKRAIANAFLDFADSQKALPKEQRALWQIYEIDGFVPATPGIYDGVAKVYEAMRQ
jgi:phosphonate transport system substrate-binding protein